MTEPLFVGVDGGGTHLRVAVCGASMNVLALGEFDAANPSGIGRDEAAARIRGAITATLERAHVSIDAVSGAGIGIAGASADHAADWLDAVMRGVLPNAVIALSSDMEIALVGANGRRCGVLVLAGTGSAVFGVSRSGEAVQVGGWGYLLGDEGSGYWIGRESLRALTLFADKRLGVEAENLSQKVTEALNFAAPKDVIAWLYAQPRARVADVARLAEIVFAEAERGDEYARHIVDQAADQLSGMARAALRRLNDPDLPIAFAGGLLEQDSHLRRRLCTQLGLGDAPGRKYPPVIGAALLAQQHWTENH